MQHAVDDDRLRNLNARMLVGLAVRAARRSLLRQPPVVRLKRHQKMVDDLGHALRIAEELPSGEQADMSFLRKAVRAGLKVGDVVADIRQGPNQLEINLRQGNPVDTVVAAICAACQAGNAGVAAALGCNVDAQECFEAMLACVRDAMRADAGSVSDVEAACAAMPGRFTDWGPAVDISDTSFLGPVA